MDNTLWAVEPTYLKKYLEKIENATLEDRQKAFEIFQTEGATNDILSVQGDTAYITIKGRLTNAKPSYISKFFGFNATVYQDIIDAVMTVQASDQVKEVRLIMDTPGGVVDGLDETYQAIMELRKHKKVTAIATGLVASAGYWLASAADEIWATAPTNEFGSIGVVVAFTSWKNYDERLGIKDITIVSKNAPKKFPDIDTKEGRDIIRERIDATERVFISRIAEGRKIAEEKVISDFGKGGVLIAWDPDEGKPDAFSTGMIDALKFDMVITAGCADKKRKGFSAEDNQSLEIAGNSVAADRNDSEKLLTNSSNDPNIDENPANGETTINQSKANEGKKTMDLMEFLKENAGAKAQFDAAIVEAREKGSQSGSDRVEARIKKVVPYLNKESKYPEAIKTLAVKVLTGESGFDALEGAAAVLDAQAETAASETAQSETEATGETNAVEQGNAVSPDGTLNSEQDLQAAIQRVTDARGA